MKSILKQFLLLHAFVLLAGCSGTKVDCPAFDNEILEWVPYEENQVIKFKNLETNDTLDLVIGMIDIRHTNSYMSNKDCGTCDDFIEINKYYEGETNLYLDLHLNKNVLKSESYLIQSSAFESSSTSTVIDYTNYNFNGITYSQVKEYRSYGSNQNFTKLFVAKNYGIISLEDKDGNTWARYPTADYIITDDLQFKVSNTSCE